MSDSSEHGIIQPTSEFGGILYIKPRDEGVPKNNEWYMAYARYVSTKYNPVIPRFNVTPISVSQVSARWATEVLENESFVKSQQESTMFNFLGTDEQNNALPTKFIKDTTPFSIYKFILGNIIKNCMTLPDTVYANAISSEALQDKNLSINLAKLKIDFPEQFAQMQQNGVNVQPMGGKEFPSHDDVEEFAQTMQDDLSSYFTAEAKDFLYSQHFEEKIKKMGEYLIPSYFNCVKLEPKGNDIEWQVYRPAQCIWDNTFDDELGRRQRFCGFVENYSIPKLLSIKEYNWSDKEIQDIQAIATEIGDNTDTVIALNNMQGAANLVWWGMLSKTPSVAAVKAYWLSFDEDTQTETWYQCDLIGNKYAKNTRLCDNLTVNKDGTLNPPLNMFIPELTYGVNYSIIHKMREMSHQIVGINAKILSLIARAKGKIPMFMGSKFPPTVDQPSLLRQIAAGLVYIKDVDIDSMREEAKNGRIAEVMDLTAAVQDIQIMRQEVLYWEKKMHDLASTPYAALGSQTQIIGAKVQENTITQSTYGMLSLYRGFMLYIMEILNVQAQMKKNLISTLKSDEEVKLQVSPRQFKLFKVTKDMSLADLQIYLTQQDQMDEADKQHIQALAEREASIPNSWFSTLDAVKLMTLSSKTEMYNYLAYQKKRFEEKQAILQAKQDKIATEQSQQANQTQENMEVVRQVGADKRLDKQLISNEVIEEMKVESKEDIHLATLLADDLRNKQEMELEQLNQPPQGQPPTQQ